MVKPPYPEWSVEDKIAYSGKRSFKGFMGEGGNFGRMLFFSPVLFEVGKPACFSVMMKAQGRCKVLVHSAA